MLPSLGWATLLEDFLVKDQRLDTIRSCHQRRCVNNPCNYTVTTESPKAGVFVDVDDVTEGTQNLLSRHPGLCASHACPNNIALV